ncbi:MULTISPECIES: DNA cytosine methyltransferase [unclassified Pseudomonas]|uniref:DNA cytosine methyltransferase n=1 Tax=unclassified Pseudomonas TaxID=196821 RepID=UPI00320A76CE
MPITYGSVCSGIEAATQAWHPLGMRAAWFAEIEPFPSAILAHHYPDVPNHGDMTKLAALVLAGKIAAPDVLVGGTPCQAFSVAGTLNANGKAAGSATQQDAESGLLVVHGTQDPDVRFEQAHTLGRNNGMENAVLAFSCKDHGADAGDVAPTLRAMNHSGSHANAGGQVAVCITGDITHTLKADGFDGSEDGTGRGQPIVAAFAENSRAELRYESGDGSITGALGCGGGKAGQGMPSAQVGASVRRLIPRECERLQGMVDDYTLIPWRGKPASECPDGPRYKAIGNSKAVPCVRWIGRRIIKQITSSPYG